MPEFAEIVSVFGSPQIRHVGTIGGNIINASPIADSLPFLFVMEAELELAGPSGRRRVNINDFYQGYKKFDLRAGRTADARHHSAAASERTVAAVQNLAAARFGYFHFHRRDSSSTRRRND